MRVRICICTQRSGPFGDVVLRGVQGRHIPSLVGVLPPISNTTSKLRCIHSPNTAHRIFRAIAFVRSAGNAAEVLMVIHPFISWQWRFLSSLLR